MLKTTVKVSSITNLSDARYCAGMGVEMVGFVMDKFSSQYISSEKVKEISSWLAGVKLVGETQSADFEEIKENIENIKIDILQISDTSLFPKITELGVPIILKLESDSAFLKENFERFLPFVEYFLIEGDVLSDLLRYELKAFAQDYPIILGCDVNSQNVHELLDEIMLKGIALKGENEVRPGLMNAENLMEILESLEID